MLNDSQVHSVKSAISDVGFQVQTDLLSFRQPRNPEDGDVALLCFEIAQQLSKPVQEVAHTIAKTISESKKFAEAKADGGYVNITLLSTDLFPNALQSVSEGPAKVAKPDRIMVEYLSPNTNKPLHLGHLRNGVLGVSLSRVLRAVGHTVVPSMLVNDRGAHICKSMLAWKRFMSGETPESTDKKPDHFVGDCYVRYNEEAKKDPSLENDVAKLLQLWEAGDPETMDTWNILNDWVYEGFKTTLDDFGFDFDIWYYESHTYTLGKDIIEEGLSRGVFEKFEDGAVVFRLKKDVFGLREDKTEGVAAVLRADGTSVYLTQDIGTAVVKAEDYDLNRSIYVVACEQNHHFKVLFEILKQLDYSWATMCYHLSYEMVELPDGRMKSREGTVVDADTLLDEMTLLAEKELAERDGTASLDGGEQKRRARIIALSAIKFYLLRYKPQKKVKFDPERSGSLTGDTGPYCLYSYARARSILKNQAKFVGVIDLDVLGNPEERNVATRLLFLAASIEKSAEEYDTSLLAQEVLELAKSFNRFYAKCPVLREPNAKLKSARLVLVDTVGQALAKSLGLLGIEVLEEM